MLKTRIAFVLAATMALSGCITTLGDDAFEPAKVQTKSNEIVFPEPPDDPRFYYERTLMSSADVKAETKTDVFRRAMTGEQRTGEGMIKPYSMAVHKGRIFVGDTVRRVVLVFDYAQDKYFTVGDTGEGLLTMPMGLDVDKHGNLYVVDGTSKKIMMYNRDGVFQRALALPKGKSGLVSPTRRVGGRSRRAPCVCGGYWRCG